MREALDALDCVVVIDVALTETARLAHYVLPAPSQYEKWEAAFFTLEFPRNTFQLRAPVIDPLPGTLPEPEIHRRLVRALGAYTDADLAPCTRPSRRAGRPSRWPSSGTLSMRPELSPYAALLSTRRWADAGRRPRGDRGGVGPRADLLHGLPRERGARGHESGDALFDAILAHPEGVTFTVDPYEETWARMDTADGRVNLAVPELLELLRALPAAPPARDAATPSCSRRASAARRRPTPSSATPRGARRTARRAAREPRRRARVGRDDGDRVRVTTRRGSAEAVVEVSATMRAGHVSLPNGTGVGGAGVSPNELTSGGDRDPIAGTPWHKHVPARIERVA
jgi:hypothetical protein